MRQYQDVACGERYGCVGVIKAHPSAATLNVMEVRQLAGWEGEAPGRRQFGLAKQPGLQAKAL